MKSERLVKHLPFRNEFKSTLRSACLNLGKESQVLMSLGKWFHALIDLYWNEEYNIEDARVGLISNGVVDLDEDGGQWKVKNSFILCGVKSCMIL